MADFKQNTQSGGFIRWILIIVVIIVLLSYFGVDLRALFEDDQTQSNFSFVFDFLESTWSFIVNIWNTYIQEPATFIWNFIRENVWDRWVTPLFDTIESTEPRDVIEDVPNVE